ncbi:MAG: hypothetical protein ACJ74Q_14015 [Pyrinomonadaceae bacterium]
MPYHLVKFTGGQGMFKEAAESEDPFTKTAAHFLKVLCLRTTITERVGIGRAFTLKDAADACDGDAYAAAMTLGQMIKVGLVDFDTRPCPTGEVKLSPARRRS